jgi:hypothetical protein
MNLGEIFPGLMEALNPTFAWRDWAESRKTSVGIAGFSVDILALSVEYQF